jgi:glycosyltransferase involved in cell wall biosynthesis
MKTLQVITSLGIGGAERLLVDAIPLYIEKGVDMELLLLNGNETPFYRSLKNNGVKIHCLTKGKIKKIYNPLLVFRIIPYLRQYDIIHVHLFPTLYWVALAKLFSVSRKKFVYTEHNTHNNRRDKGGIWKITDRFAYRQYNRIVSITAEADRLLKAHLLLDEGKFTIINNGIDLSKYAGTRNSRQTAGTDKQEITIIQIAAFSKQKDQATLIRSMSYLPNNVRLLLAGDGETRSECEKLTKELNLSERISFLGIRTDIPQLLQVADITVLSTHYEGLSLSSIEAMASGKPFVASDVPGLRDVVGGAALLFPCGVEKALADQIQSLTSDSELYNKVAQACTERSKNYDIRIMTDRYIEVYATTTTKQ